MVYDNKNDTDVYFGEEYISNLVDCANIKDSKALRFIGLVDGDSFNYTNLNPDEIANLESTNNPRWHGINYHPNLIIYIGSINFFHKTAFIIYEVFPRYLDFYYVRIWNKPPQKQNDFGMIDKIKQIYELMLQYKTNLQAKTDLTKIVRELDFLSKSDKKLLDNGKIEMLFKKINDRMLIYKYDNNIVDR